MEPFAIQYREKEEEPDHISLSLSHHKVDKLILSIVESSTGIYVTPKLLNVWS